MREHKNKKWLENMAITIENSNKTVAETRHQPLRENVETAINNYFAQLGDQPTSNIYEMVITEIEEPLFHAIMRHTRNNQSRAARLLGLSRGTLRKKLKIYDLL